MMVRPVIPIDFFAWAWAFVPGMVVAHVAVRRPDVLVCLHRPGALLLGLVLVACSVDPDIRFPDVAAAIGSAVVLGWLLTCSPPSRPVVTGMAIGAALSYSVYLWHEAVLDSIGRRAGVIGLLSALVVTCAVASVAYVVVERPAIRVGRLLARRPQRAPAAVGLEQQPG
jgi:peptidoglycan/LPS O-acetylase OafA/YrhL